MRKKIEAAAHVGFLPELGGATIGESSAEYFPGCAFNCNWEDFV